MSNSASNPNGAGKPSARPSRTGWRTVDAVVAAVIGVAFGVVFALWNVLWNALQPAFIAFPPAQGFMYGMWMLPGVLGMLVVRKRGAAVFTEVIAALVSMLFGAGWGLTILIWGLLEGLFSEAVFAGFRYRRYAATVALLAGGSAGLIASVLDTAYYYPAWAFGWKLVYGVLLVISSAVIAGAGGIALVKALRHTGVLAPFASGRE